MKKLISLILMLIAFVAFTSTALATEKPPGAYILCEYSIMPSDSKASKTQSTSAGGLPYLCNFFEFDNINVPANNTKFNSSAGGLIRLC